MNSQIVENALANEEMSKSERERVRISTDEALRGIGTKSDVGKLELHLLPTSVFFEMAIDSTWKKYIEILGRINDKSEKWIVFDMLIDFKRHLIKCSGMSDVEALEAEVAVLMHGKYKYSYNNWSKIDPPLRYYDALGRHLLHIAKDGSGAIDQWSGLPAIAHCFANLSFFAELILIRDPFDGYDNWVEREKSHMGLTCVHE